MSIVFFYEGWMSMFIRKMQVFLVLKAEEK